MKPSVYLFLSILSIIKIDQIFGITCYDCTNCPSPFNSSLSGVSQLQCTGSCRVRLLINNNDLLIST
jgi:hypothetical protein